MVPEESTTPELAGLVRRGFQAATQGDLDTVIRGYHPDAIFEVCGLGSRFDGVTAIRGFIEDWRGAYEDWSIAAEEIVDVGKEVLFVVAVQTGRPVGSTSHVRYRFAQVITLADGVTVRVSGYNDVDEARADAGALAESRG